MIVLPSDARIKYYVFVLERLNNNHGRRKRKQ